jgi:AcrR family transcriptional regulator
VSPTQAERREATTAALVEAARELFAADGYAATALDAVARKAGVTKGAVYHHFDGKRQVFEAVFAGEVERVSGSLTAAYAEEEDGWDGLRAACQAFLDVCLEPGMQRIVFHDAFGALGWERIRRLEAGMLDAMEWAIERAVEDGRIERRPAAPLASFLFGALCESAMSVARAPDQGKAKREAAAELDRVMDGLASRRR